MRHPRKRTKRIFRLFLLPLLLLVIMQAVLSFGTVILGGTFSTLQSYAVDRLSQVTETRQIILEGQMVQKWSSMEEECAAAQQTLSELLEKHHIGLETFQADQDLQEEYLTSLLPTWAYMMRKNSTTGAFLALTNDTVRANGGSLSALYLRDGDPDTNPTDYSDLLLAVGPSSMSQKYQLPLDIHWRSELSLLPEGEREADQFIYAPLLAAYDHPMRMPTDNSFWSRPFCLEDNASDAYRMITYSVPLTTGDGQVYGVMGIEISLPYLEESLPYREVDSGHRGGYLLLERAGEDSYRLVDASGPTAGQATMNLQELTLEPTGIGELFRLSGTQQDVYLILVPLRLYNTNTPYYDQGWYLAGLETHKALFGISDTLSSVFVAATLFSLAAAILLAVLLVRYVTGPIRRLSTCIQNSPEHELAAFPPSYIAEVDELYDTIRRLTSRQKQIEFDLLEEKERYRMAIQSSSDVLVSHDLDHDRAILYNLDGNTSEEVVDGLTSALRTHDYIHPDDRRVVLARIAEAQTDLSVSFRMDWRGQGENYQWYELNGRILPAGEGRPRTFIGSVHNIHDQKLREMAAYESLHRDSLTGLYRRASGEDIVRSSIQSGHNGCLLLLDVRGLGALNQNMGIVAGNTVLEEVGYLLRTWRETEDNTQCVLLRLGGDEFLLWLEEYDRAAAQSVAEQLSRRAESLYSGGKFTASLACGCAQVRPNEDYASLLTRACQALAAAKTKSGPAPVWAEELPPSTAPADSVITPIEYTLAPHRSIIARTFAFFDRGGEVGSVLSLLFPKLGRDLDACDIILSQVSRDFFTAATIYQWHRPNGAAEDREIAHFTAETFSALETELWADNSEPLSVATLSDQQRSFLRAPAGRDGLAFPLYDNGSYMGALLVLRQPDQEPWPLEWIRQLHEMVKVVEANLNRQRYDSASRAKSDFLSRMSHEIRTPMNAVIGMTYIAKTHTQDPKAVAADLEKIDQSSHYLLGLINDILDMSRIESGKMTIESTSFDLLRLLDRVADLIRPQTEMKQIRFRVETQVGQPWVVGDSLHINQVLINLLGNAVKFTPEQGTITLTVHQADDGEVFFSVKDTGIGVSPENQERIFRSFEQAEKDTVRQYGGTGLGLAISSRLVRMMGGVIELDSALGQGSDFYFTIHLPFAQDVPLPQESAEEVGQHLAVEGLRVLLVEDNELNIEIAQSILEMHGIEAILAHNGREAVDCFTASQPGDFDLILMDIRMPVMDGLEATKAIRQSGHPLAASIPIIAMTANAFDEDMKRSVESGMNGHLSKPLDFDKVLQVIAQVMERKETEK